MKYERHNWGKVWQEGLAFKKGMRRTQRTVILKKGVRMVRGQCGGV